MNVFKYTGWNWTNYQHETYALDRLYLLGR
jgi:hypothetical protein